MTVFFLVLCLMTPLLRMIGAESQFIIPHTPLVLSSTVIEGIKNYVRVYFWDSKCVYLAVGNRTGDATIASIVPQLGKLVVPWGSVEAVGARRFCYGLIILAEDSAVVSAVMQKAVKVNWSFKVLVLVQSEQPDAKDHGNPFTQEEMNFWRSYDILLIQFGSTSFHARQCLIHQSNFEQTSPEILKSDVTSRKDIDGVEFRMFLEIARQFNFSWNLNVPPGNDKWGMPRVNESGPFGMMKMLIDRKIEVSICSWWLEIAKLTYIDYSAYWQTVCATFLLPKPHPYVIQWTCFIRPFAVELWALLIITTCFVVCIYWMNFDEHLRIKPVVTFDQSCLQIWGMLLMNDGYNPEGRGNRKFNRVVLTIWGMFALNIVSAYSGSLAARLTLPEFEPMIHTPEDLSRSKYPLTSFYHSSWLVYTAQKYNIKLRLIKTSETLMDETPSAYLTKRVGKSFFMEVESLSANRLKDLRTSKYCLARHYMTFALPRGSGLARLFNPIIRRLVESGITTYWLRRVFESQYAVFPFIHVYEYRQKLGFQISLSLFFLQSAFVVLLLGNATGLLTLFVEIYKNKKEEQKIREVLRPDLTRKHQLTQLQKRESKKPRCGQLIETLPTRKKVTSRRNRGGSSALS